MDIKHTLRLAVAPVLALTLVGCAGSGMGSMETESTVAAGMDVGQEQVLFRIENVSEEHFMRVALRDLDGNDIPLGTVQDGSAENFVLELPDRTENLRLVATSPETTESDEAEVVVSEPFMLHGGATVNWFIVENELEIS